VEEERLPEEVAFGACSMTCFLSLEGDTRFLLALQEWWRGPETMEKRTFLGVVGRMDCWGHVRAFLVWSP
jgi:hypothetical protein